MRVHYFNGNIVYWPYNVVNMARVIDGMYRTLTIDYYELEGRDYVA